MKDKGFRDNGQEQTPLNREKNLRRRFAKKWNQKKDETNRHS